jgi:hypothetical protein
MTKLSFFAILQTRLNCLKPAQLCGSRTCFISHVLSVQVLALYTEAFPFERNDRCDNTYSTSNAVSGLYIRNTDEVTV